MQREPSERVRKEPVRLIDETGPALFDQDLRPVPVVFDVQSLCFCGKREDDTTGRYVPCGLCQRFCHLSCAGISGDDIPECMHRSYVCPTCKSALNGNREQIFSEPIAAVLKPLVAINFTISGGYVGLNVASNALPIAYPVDKTLTGEILDCVKTANQVTQLSLAACDNSVFLPADDHN